MNYAKRFALSHPKAIDFPQDEYASNQDAIDAAATAAGYRLAGIRLGFVVFTTKGVDIA
jgi:hypothetical protein